MPLSLVRLLEGAARRHPERPAVAAAGGPALSWAELERASAGVAGALQKLGVVRGDRVGLYLPKSRESVVGLWGVLRAGAAYVPIDPAQPPARAVRVAVDSGMRALVASAELAPGVAALCEARPELAVLQLHGDGEVAGGARRPGPPEAFARCPLHPRDLAYVLYTSGSTGQPKGVAVSHGAALAFAEWAAETFGLGPEDVLGNHAPFHFDLSTFDVFASAAAGARCVVLDDETARFPAACVDAAAEEGIRVWYSVPGALRRMLSAGGLARRELPALRTVLFAGEAFPVEELRALQAALPGRALFNLYGPTETNVCTFWPVPDLSEWAEPAIPIGFDCESCEGVAVGEDLRPVGQGEVGELLVGGGTLMEGYWGDAERTARVFVADPRRPEGGGRFYRTGDLVSRRPDGSWAFHGRRDHMVKVRGYRVELGEVETALLRCREVREAAVVAAPREVGGARETGLVAFVAGPPEEERAAPGRIRREAATWLPKYMIPAEIRVVGALPTTSTGKVDRQALRARLVPPEGE